MNAKHAARRLQFAGHETFPLRQLWLRKAYCAVADAKECSEPTNKVFGDPSAIARFGVGKNMVASIRHWALACDVLTDAPNSELKAGEIGQLLFGPRAKDPYLELPATSWLIHWLLAGRAERSTTWEFIFNRIAGNSFTRASAVEALAAFAQQKEVRVSAVTLKRDVEVCIRCYLSKKDSKDADDAAEPLLADLGLLAEGAGDTIQFRRGEKPNLPNALFVFALLDYWHEWEHATGSAQRSLSFESIAHDYRSPGRVFKLDENSVSDRLSAIADTTEGALIWSDSSGIRQVTLGSKVERPKLMQAMLRAAYAK